MTVQRAVYKTADGLDESIREALMGGQEPVLSFCAAPIMYEQLNKRDTFGVQDLDWQTVEHPKKFRHAVVIASNSSTCKKGVLYIKDSNRRSTWHVESVDVIVPRHADGSIDHEVAEKTMDVAWITVGAGAGFKEAHVRCDKNWLF